MRIDIDVIEHLCYNIPMAQYQVIGTDTDGKEIRLYESDGSIRNWRGQLLVKHPQAVEITADTTHDYTKRRKQKILDAIEQNVMDITRTNVPADAIGKIVGKRAEIAMNDNTRTGNDAARLVLQAIDAYQDKVDNTRTNVLRHEYSIDSETRALLDAMIQERRDTTTDAEIIGENE
jgi:hypothetical protein